MITRTVTPTRIQLKTLTRRLKIAERGHKMLKDKYEEMIKIFALKLKETLKLRLKVEREFVPLMQEFLSCRSNLSNSELSRAFDGAKCFSIQFDTKNLLNIDMPFVTITKNENQTKDINQSKILPDFLVQKVQNFVPVLCKLAKSEREIKLLSIDIERTKRRVNALSENLIPSLIRDIKYIKLKLEENDRASQVRLLKYKNLK